MKRYVYLMERNPSILSWIIGFFGGRREIKIGVAKNAEERELHVDSGIPGRVVVIDKYLIREATKTEAELHKKFRKHRFTVREGKRGSGKTEFFRLTNSQIQEIREILRERKVINLWLELGVMLIIFFLSMIVFFSIEISS